MDAETKCAWPTKPLSKVQVTVDETSMMAKPERAYFDATTVQEAVIAERERLAELMERQHTWISSVSAARLIRGNSSVLMHGYVDPFHVEPAAWRVKVGDFWIHGGTREGLVRAVAEQLAIPLQELKPEPLYSHPADRAL